MYYLTNTYFNNLPSEIIDYIWEFNYYDAALIINYYIRKYITNSVKELEKMILFATNSHLGFKMTTYKLFYRNKIMTKNDVFLRMKACQCCKSHQILKPNEFIPWIETQVNWPKNIKTCKCICRHYSRILCRTCY